MAIRWWQLVWRGDAQASDLAMQGEHRIARWRFALTAFLTVVGGVLVVSTPSDHSFQPAVPVNLVCLAFATAFLVATRRGECPVWLSMTTAIYDVSLVSMLLALDAWQGNVSVAVNGRTTFMGYFLALVGTCVRWDRRVAVVAGMAAAAQYAAIVAWCAMAWPSAATADVVRNGTLDLGVQVERIAMLGIFGLMCGGIAQWATRLREHATTDVLTGLLNRRTFEERLRDELLRAERLQSSLSVVMVDVDHFKRINDQFGHQVGDAVLRDVAATLRESVRRTDLLCRWGGEEFAIAYLDTPFDDATRQAEMLRQRVGSAPLAPRGAEEMRITISAGVSALGCDADDVEGLVRVADARLLQAKRLGRDRVITTQVPVVA